MTFSAETIVPFVIVGLAILCVLAMYRAFQKRGEKYLETARIQAYERASELRILKDLAEILNQTLPPERALVAGLEQVARQVGASAGWLLTLTPDFRAELSAGYNLPENMELASVKNHSWALCNCLKETLGNQLAEPRRFDCERLARTPGIAENQKQHLSIPVRASGVTVGILNLVMPPERSFDEVEMRLISSLGDQFGGAVERARLFRDVHRLAITDSLTGLYNRRHLLAMTVAEMERAKRYGHSISLAILDIDHFKQINDTFGHLAGDQVLVEVARACQEIIRRVDLIGRFGGEEILILMPETTPDQAVVAMERLREQIERLDIKTSRGSVRLTISVGMTSLNREEMIDFDDFLDRADQALYLAKNGGRNQVRVI